jgi:hypothetical protein
MTTSSVAMKKDRYELDRPLYRMMNTEENRPQRTLFPSPSPTPVRARARARAQIPAKSCCDQRVAQETIRR